MIFSRWFDQPGEAGFASLPPPQRDQYEVGIIVHFARFDETIAAETTTPE